MDGRMTTALEDKMNKLQAALKARTKSDGVPKNGYERNVAHIRAEMELLSSRIEYAQAQMNQTEEEDGE
jgi:hypothetical protein